MGWAPGLQGRAGAAAAAQLIKRPLGCVCLPMDRICQAGPAPGATGKEGMTLKTASNPNRSGMEGSIEQSFAYANGGEESANSSR